MTGNHHGLRRIVDDQVDARRSFQSANIAALAPDDLSFELIVGQRKHRYRAFCDEIAGQDARSPRRQSLASAHGFFLGLLFDDANVASPDSKLGLFEHLIDKTSLRLLSRQARNLLELFSRFVNMPLVFNHFFFDVPFSRSLDSDLAWRAHFVACPGVDPFVDSLFFC
mgnify:CR=1 FL=1